MSRRRQIEERLGAFGDIRDILGAMKNLALMEVHKLARLQATQREWTESLEAVAADVLHFYPEVRAAPGPTVYVALGSERAFCGDFNERVAETLCARRAASARSEGPIIAVGRRLWPLLENLTPAPMWVEGASVAEETEAALARVVRALDERRRAGERAPWRSLSIVHHDPRSDVPLVAELAPFRHGLAPTRQFAYPALANEPPAALVAGVAEEYLFAALSAVLCESLAAENTRRLHHMDNALRRLDERVLELDLKRGTLRREEITEEIEGILLSVDVVVNPIRHLKNSRPHAHPRPPAMATGTRSGPSEGKSPVPGDRRRST